MGQYTVRRILLIVPTLFVASLFLALMLRVLPGDAVAAAGSWGTRPRVLVLNEVGATIARAKLGLDKPFHVQYIRWIVGWPKERGGGVPEYRRC